MAQNVDQLQHAVALVVDDPHAVAVERERLVAFAFARGEHDLEAALVVRRLGLEAVARGLQQVGVVACHVVDEVQVAEVHRLVAHRDAVAAVLLRLEVDRHLARRLHVHHCVVGAVDGDAHPRVVRVELELLQCHAVAEAQAGAVARGRAAGARRHVNVQDAAAAGGGRPRGCHLLVGACGLHHDGARGTDRVGAARRRELVARAVQHVVVQLVVVVVVGRHVGVAHERVADEVPSVEAFRAVGGVAQRHVVVAVARTHRAGRSGDGRAVLAGIDVARHVAVVARGHIRHGMVRQAVDAHPFLQLVAVVVAVVEVVQVAVVSRLVAVGEEVREARQVA